MKRATSHIRLVAPGAPRIEVPEVGWVEAELVALQNELRAAVRRSGNTATRRLLKGTVNALKLARRRSVRLIEALDREGEKRIGRRD